MPGRGCHSDLVQWLSLQCGLILISTSAAAAQPSGPAELGNGSWGKPHQRPMNGSARVSGCPLPESVNDRFFSWSITGGRWIIAGTDVEYEHGPACGGLDGIRLAGRTPCVCCVR